MSSAIISGIATLTLALKKAREENATAAVLKEHIALIDRATKPVLEEHAMLQKRVAELEELVRRLTDELKDRTQKQRAAEISETAFRILSWIFDEDGQVTDERIAERLKITDPEINLHVRRLYEKCFISYPSDDLDDPIGYRICPDGSEYVLRKRKASD